MRFILATIVIALLAFFLVDNAQAQNVCETPSQTVERLYEMSESNGNFEFELFDYEGVRAQAARQFILSQVPNPEEVYEFDRMIIAIREGFGSGYIAIYKDGCQIVEFTDTVEHLNAITAYVRGA